MRHWSMTHSMKGYSAVLEDVPGYVLVADIVGNKILDLTGHVLCCNIPDIAWKIPMGSFERDEDGLLVHTAGTIMWRLGMKLSAPFHRKYKRIAEVVLDPEVAQQINPDFFQECEEVMANINEDLAPDPEMHTN